MKRLILIGILMAQFGLLHSQQTYNGPYKLTFPFLQNGTAKYNYSENPETLERVKSGPFHFTFGGTGEYLGYKQTITGNYKNNLKDGLWTITIEYNDFEVNRNLFNTGKQVLKANYKDGYPIGQWTVDMTEKSRKKVYNQQTKTFVWGVFTEPNSVKATAHFRNGQLVQSFNFLKEDKSAKTKTEFSCPLDSAGFANGRIILTFDNKQEVYECKSGFLIKELQRDLQSGSILKSEVNERDISFLEQYDRFKSSNPDSLNAMPAKLVEDYLGDGRIERVIHDYFFNRLYNFQDIPGDVLYSKYDGYKYSGIKVKYFKEL